MLVQSIVNFEEENFTFSTVAALRAAYVVRLYRRIIMDAVALGILVVSKSE